ncbi:flagellar basal body P-ring protein FlgI [Aporhodopirellula aestuarii]|uniref:Flagellar basal body P-ring protein FlgI n=1 Tax=Aporhodopirellula aestuarii TaxID=2950107 RepID=A0ABT0TZL3_9BACT|nr:flagellar basal body P-ring protein FlgI [Aporhodopirellula aestuarii]MCM2370049.1 flagellar basal body P-ring protein FlgI [Aporhodopirellula aestuarii]
MSRAPTLFVCRAVLCFGVTLSVGCASWLNRGNKDDSEHFQKLLKVPEPPELIREAAVPHGLQEIRVDGVAVVNQLPGTGGPALPSTFRDRLLEEMKRNEVAEPNEFLERDDNALVQVRGLIPPGARRGDSIDLQILTPPKTEATNLHGGWLLDTRLRHQQILNNSIRSSDVLAIGTGPVLTRGDFDGTEDTTLHVSGRVLSGGLVQSDRKLGLVIRPKYQHVKIAKAIADAINNRFYFFDGTTRRGIAKAVEDDFVEIDVHPRYRQHEERLMAVVRAITVAPESSSTQAKLVDLGEKLRVPSTAADAALQLEAIGEGAIPTLVEATKLSNPELRFYAAETLAYLDRAEAIEPLVEGIRLEPAFRAPALSAMLGLKQAKAVSALQGLLDESSLETRYGAMTVLRDRKDARDSLGGENLKGQFRLYQIKSSGPPAVVASLTRKPEIVLMGEVSPLNLQSFFIGPAGLVVRRVAAHDAETPVNQTQGGTRLRISRFRPGRPDAFAEVEANLAGLIRGITEVGGGYGDAVATLRMAKEQGVLVDQLAFDPLPKSQRTYLRDHDSSEDDEELEDDVDEKTL